MKRGPLKRAEVSLQIEMNGRRAMLAGCDHFCRDERVRGEKRAREM